MRFEHITVRDGLPENSVVQILQDYQGFLWFGTQNGLVKYDGYKYTVYNFDPSDIHSIVGRIIFSLYEDKAKDIWIGTEFGLSKYDRENNWFENFSLGTNIQYDYFSIGEDDYGNIYFGSSTSMGLYKFDKSNKTYMRFQHDSSNKNSISSNFISSVLREDSTSILIGTVGGGLNKFNIKTQIFMSYKKIPGDPNSISSNNIYSIFKDRKGNIWIGTDFGLNRFNEVSETFTVFGISASDSINFKGYQIPCIHEDVFGNIWLAVFDYGLVKFEPGTGRFTRYENDPGKSFSLSRNSVTSVLMDLSEVLWVGTYWEGLHKYDWQKSQFLIFTNNTENNNNEFVNAILKDSSDVIWIGMRDGLYKFDEKTNTFVNFEEIIGKKGKLSSNVILKLFIDSHSYFWIGTKDGLNKYDSKKASISIYKHVEGNIHSISANKIHEIYEDKKNNLWIGTDNGLNIFDRKDETFKSYYHNESDSNTISNNDIFWIYEDSFHDFWIGTNNGGLNKFDRENQTSIRYFYPKLGFWSISEIHEDKKGKFWMGSYFTGLNLFDRNTGTISSIAEKDGLINNTVEGIIEDNEGNLWISTDYGLSRFNPETNKIKNFDRNDLPITRFLAAELKDENGYIYFGGQGGFIKFHPDSIKGNEHIPKIVLTEFMIFNEAVKPGENSPLKKNINVADEIILTYEQNQFSLEFAALDYRNSLRNQYAYMLEGFNKDWIFSGTNRTATYTHMDPGEYVFWVKGSNNDGIWNEKGTSIRIVITPPWWQRLWFRISSVLLLAVIFGGTIRYVSVQRLKRRLEIEKERSRISKDMHDEVGSSLTKISILSELAKQKTNEPRLKSDVEKISQSASEVVDNISEIIWAINPSNDTLDNLIAYIREYAVETLDLKNIGYKIEIPDNIPQLSLSAEVRRNIFLVIKEALNNIVKYAKANMVHVSVKFPDSMLEISIKDNGIGFDMKHTRMFGNGLINMKKRIEDIEGDFILDSKIGSGTEIRLRLKPFR